MKFLLLLLVVLATVNSSEMSKKCKKDIRRYGKCLKAGFQSSLGCESGEGSVTGRKLKICTKRENKAAACGHTCVKDCQNGNGADYRGTVAVTKSGRKCQTWASQSPNHHTRTAANYPNSGLEDNYCRNPDGEVGAWCYNDEGTHPRWELCDIPRC